MNASTAADLRIREELVVRLPDVPAGTLDQDAEWCEVQNPDGSFERLRFHDYDKIFGTPGLYERLFYDELECTSPRTVRELLRGVCAEQDIDPEDLVVLDVGAGNGMVGEELAAMGARTIVGVDILEEAALATERDRPGLYEDYRVVDLTALEDEDHAALDAHDFTCMASVAALGFGDIPPKAFEQAFDFLADDGLVAFTIKDRFLDAVKDNSGFGALLHDLHAAGRLEMLVEHRYQHRLSVAGDPLHYVACVGRKRAAA